MSTAICHILPAPYRYRAATVSSIIRHWRVLVTQQARALDLSSPDER
jgi:hypothetical protein